MASKLYIVMGYVQLQQPDPKRKSAIGYLPVYEDRRKAEKENPDFEIKEVEFIDEAVVQ